jgi:hypothetical protein
MTFAVLYTKRAKFSVGGMHMFHIVTWRLTCMHINQPGRHLAVERGSRNFCPALVQVLAHRWRDIQGCTYLIQMLLCHG